LATDGKATSDTAIASGRLAMKDSQLIAGINMDPDDKAAAGRRF
jgi:hypothetical protein